MKSLYTKVYRNKKYICTTKLNIKYYWANSRIVVFNTCKFSNLEEIWMSL